MRVLVRPLAEPQREVDVTDRLVSAIAEELWRRYGGNAALNWLEAERHLERILAHAQASTKTPVREPMTVASAIRRHPSAGSGPAGRGAAGRGEPLEESYSMPGRGARRPRKAVLRDDERRP